MPRFKLFFVRLCYHPLCSRLTLALHSYTPPNALSHSSLTHVIIMHHQHLCLYFFPFAFCFYITDRVLEHIYIPLLLPRPRYPIRLSHHDSYVALIFNSLHHYAFLQRFQHLGTPFDVSPTFTIRIYFYAPPRPRGETDLTSSPPRSPLCIIFFHALRSSYNTFTR